MKDHWLAFLGVFIAIAIAVCAFAPWQDTDDAAGVVRAQLGDDALTFVEATRNPALCDGIGVEKIPFGVRVGGGQCPEFLTGARSYVVTFWGGVLSSEN